MPTAMPKHLMIRLNLQCNARRRFHVPKVAPLHPYPPKWCRGTLSDPAGADGGQAAVVVAAAVVAVDIAVATTATPTRAATSCTTRYNVFHFLPKPRFLYGLLGRLESYATPYVASFTQYQFLRFCVNFRVSKTTMPILLQLLCWPLAQSLSSQSQISPKSTETDSVIRLIQSWVAPHIG